MLLFHPSIGSQDNNARGRKFKDFNDVIIIQGFGGAGKSSFTKYLAATLARDGLTPLLVRLRDASNIDQGLFRSIGDALRYEGRIYLSGVGYRMFCTSG